MLNCTYMDRSFKIGRYKVLHSVYMRTNVRTLLLAAKLPTTHGAYTPYTMVQKSKSRFDFLIWPKTFELFICMCCMCVNLFFFFFSLFSIITPLCYTVFVGVYTCHIRLRRCDGDVHQLIPFFFLLAFRFVLLSFSCAAVFSF